MGKIDHIPFKWTEFLWDDDQDDHLPVIYDLLSACYLPDLLFVAVDTKSI